MRSFSDTRRSPHALVETLETRCLLSVTFGANLVINGNAESDTGSGSGNDVITPTGWTANGTPTVVKYGAPNFPSSTSPGPTARGKNFFAGGPNNSESDLFQTIDVSSISSLIDGGQIKYTLSGFLGGFSSQADEVTLFANFKNGANFSGDQASVGPVTAAQRANATGLLSRNTTGTVPPGTRFIQVQQHFDRLSGAYNDGYADNISLVLTSKVVPTTGTLNGIVFNDLSGNGAHQSSENGVPNVTVFLDKNSNGHLDTGEPKTLTNSAGVYTFSNLAAGTYKVRQVVPATFRPTSSNPVAAPVFAGTVTTVPFEDSQTVVISGNVFLDTNANKIKDATEHGLAGVTVYLDFNNNGQLDSFELKTTTDANGNYSFIEPFGTYVVRQVVPSGRAQTTPVGGFTVTLAKGAVATGKNFGDNGF
ncbi:MAG TPA: SdrD B-like domain-containing protein [Humisphaera sp.]|jgi:hypothetical protein|nr:SdrD B-like domain-containing protein [Humisphaera sp.]